MEEEAMAFIPVFVFMVAIGLAAIWNNALGHNPNMVYSSRAPLLKFYGYPLWNLIAFFSCGRLPHKSWRAEFNASLDAQGLGCYKT